MTANLEIIKSAITTHEARDGVAEMSAITTNEARDEVAVGNLFFGFVSELLNVAARKYVFSLAELTAGLDLSVLNEHVPQFIGIQGQKSSAHSVS